MKIKKNLGLFFSGLLFSSSLMASQVNCVDTVRFAVTKKLREKHCQCSTHEMLHVSPDATKESLPLLQSFVVDAVAIDKSSQKHSYYTYLVVTKPGPLGTCTVEYVGLGSVK